jgi:hypothetical protein
MSPILYSHTGSPVRPTRTVEKDGYRTYDAEFSFKLTFVYAATYAKVKTHERCAFTLVYVRHYKLLAAVFGGGRVIQLEVVQYCTVTWRDSMEF